MLDLPVENIILFTMIALFHVDKQINKTMQGVEVIMGIEKGLPMAKMTMISGMFSADERDNAHMLLPLLQSQKDTIQYMLTLLLLASGCVQ